MIAKYGLNDPAPVQYIRWIGNLLHGQFGYSITASAPVLTGFMQFFPTTLELVLYAAPLIILVGIFLGTLGAVHKDEPLDHGTRVFAIIGYSLPTFWLGLLLMMILYGFAGLFPPGSLSNSAHEVVYCGRATTSYTHLLTLDAILNWRWDIFWDAFYRIILPDGEPRHHQLGPDHAADALQHAGVPGPGLHDDRPRQGRGQPHPVPRARPAQRHAARDHGLRPHLRRPHGAALVITETIFDRKGIGWWMARAALQLDVAAIMFNVLFLGRRLRGDQPDRGSDLRVRGPPGSARLKRGFPMGTPVQSVSPPRLHPRLDEFLFTARRFLKNPLSVIGLSLILVFGVDRPAGARAGAAEVPRSVQDPAHGLEDRALSSQRRAPAGDHAAAVRHALRPDLGHAQRVQDRRAGGGRQPPDRDPPRRNRRVLRRR